MAIRAKKRNDGSVAYYYDFQHDGKRYRGLGGTTKTQALRIQEKVRTEVINGEHLGTIIEVKLGDFIGIYLERRKHIRSLAREEFAAKILLKFFNNRSLTNIQASNIEDYIVKRGEDGVANGTINRELTVLKRMFTLAIKWNYAKKNPVKEVEFLEVPPGRDRYLTADEINRLLGCCSPHLKPIVYTAVNTGMRLSEILELTWDRVHFDERTIEIIRTKNNKKRYIPLHAGMIKQLKTLRDKSSGSNVVFLGSRGVLLKSVKKPFKGALIRAKISNFRFHDLRHTFASHFIMNGGDLLSLKEILGHSSLRMVERYAHLAAEHKRKQIENLDGLLT